LHENHVLKRRITFELVAKQPVQHAVAHKASQGDEDAQIGRPCLAVRG